MNMFSEIATESTIRAICSDISARLGVTSDEGERRGLKAAGRIALQHFEWSTPPWSKDYEKLFEE